MSETVGATWCSLRTCTQTRACKHRLMRRFELSHGNDRTGAVDFTVQEQGKAGL